MLLRVIPLATCFSGPFSEPDTASQLVKYILLDRDGNFIIAKEVVTDMVIHNPSGAHAKDLLKLEFERAVAGDSAPERVEYTPLNSRPGEYAQSIHVIRDENGERLGGILFLVDVGELDAAYKSGLTPFAVLLTALGFALFGVPAVAFAVQLTYASKSQKDARFLARHDSLTGLLNRRAFMELAVQRVGSRRLTGIAFIDVDRFKSINDSQGHGVGDTVLMILARVMREVFGEDTLLARLGGDEFIIGFADGTYASDNERAQATLNMLRDRARHASLEASIGMPVTLSIGYAATTEGAGLEDFMSQADMALYTVKNSGRDGVAVYSDEMGDALKRRKFVQNLVRRGMEENRFLLHYQPLIKTSSGEVDGYEALLRLQGPDGVSVPPSEFVPIAESLGLISEIGEWVLKTATREVAALDGTPFVAVNLSVEQFRTGNIIQTVTESLKAAGLPPERLELEITESLLIDDQDGVAMIIDTLKDLGVSIAMDDFGTGFSSLSYLWKYGFDRIKIDKTFVQALEDNAERSTQLIDTVVMLGSRLGMNVTAEGIETADQAELLSSLGCDHLQGFYFGYPAPLPGNTAVPSDIRKAS